MVASTSETVILTSSNIGDGDCNCFVNAVDALVRELLVRWMR